MSSPCFSHRPAGLIPFEIRQPVPPRVRAATKFSTYRFIDVLFVFYSHSQIVMPNMWPILLSLEACSLDKPLMLIMFFFSNATSTGPGRRSELGSNDKHVATLRPTHLDRLSCSLLAAAMIQCWHPIHDAVQRAFKSDVAKKR